jgi:hypothetical protein
MFHALSRVLLVAIAASTTGAASSPSAQATSPASQFLSGLAAVCGKAYAGRIVANEPPQPNDAFEGRTLIVHVRSCESGRVLVPFHVGEDRSRTFVLTLIGDRLRLKHDHRHKDGTSDVLTMYGGESTSPGMATRQEFPVDAESKALFTREKRDASNSNTWAMELHPGRMFAYELTRPGGRKFRVEFDLTKAVPAPPAPWGH